MVDDLDSSEFRNQRKDETISDSSVQDITESMDEKISLHHVIDPNNEEQIKMMQEHQKVTEQIQMWRMVETLQNKSSIGFYKARNQLHQQANDDPGDEANAIQDFDYFQQKDMTTIIEEPTASEELTVTDNSIINNSVDNESSRCVQRADGASSFDIESSENYSRQSSKALNNTKNSISNLSLESSHVRDQNVELNAVCAQSRRVPSTEQLHTAPLFEGPQKTVVANKAMLRGSVDQDESAKQNDIVYEQTARM